MKKFFIAVILFAVVFNYKSFSQISNTTSAEIAQFKRSKIYVVLQGQVAVETSVRYSKVIQTSGGDSLVEGGKNKGGKARPDNITTEYNAALRQAMKFWNINLVEYITEEEFEEKKFNSSAYFLITTKYKVDVKEKIWLNHLAVVKGGPKARKVDKMVCLAGIPLSYPDVPEQYYVYKIPALVQFLQSYLELIFSKGPLDEKKTLDHYNKKTKEIKHGVLYLMHEDLTEKVADLGDIEKVYKGEVEIVSQGEISEAIQKRKPDVLFLHKVSPEKTMTGGFCRKYIFSAKDGELLYINEHSLSKSESEGLLESDFKQFNKK